MSKIIKICQENIDECVEEFRKVLESGKFPDGKINYTKNLGVLDRKAKIYFSEDAWVRMQALVMTSKKEIGWHGVVKRGEEKDTYYISDILVYPQEVTGVTVNTDQAEYETWLMNHEDEVFNNIRMQGHSHVNMSTSPSSVDTTLYESILAQLTDDMFYIFMIYNKNGDKTIKIYDLRENILFETSDVEVNVITRQDGIMKFLQNAKELVVEKTYASNATKTHTYSGYGYSNGYTTKYSGSYSYDKKQDKVDSDKKNDGVRKGKRTGTRATTDREYGYGNSSYNYGYGGYYDDWTDEYYENKYGIK